MANTTNFSVRMDRELNFPFEIQTNKETVAALLEAERIAHNSTVKHYSNVEEALMELKK